MWLLDGIAKIPASEARVSDLTLDSRQVRAGSLFFALPGLKEHGLRFAADAAARGASAVLWEPRADLAPPTLPPGVFAAAIPNLKTLVGRIADRFFNWPSSQLRITGITGTNGKTTCAFLLAQCLERLGVRRSLYGHDWLGTSRRPRGTHSHDPRRSHACIARSRNCAAPAYARSRWKSRRMPWISDASTACVFTSPHSPI